MYAISGPAPMAGFTSEGCDISDGGTVVGILHPTTGRRTRAFVWHTFLTILPDKGFAAEARSISQQGEIAGTVETMPGRSQAAVWDAGHNLTLLQEPADAVYSFTHGIEQGSIVGGYVRAGSATVPPMEVPLYWQTAASAPIAAPIISAWAEARAIDSVTGAACGTSSSPPYGFWWNVFAQAVGLGTGTEAMAIRGVHGQIFGSANGAPASWTNVGVPAQPLPLDMLSGRHGAANDANVSEEIVGDVFFPGLPELTTPFLRRGFRRDEASPSSGPFFFQPLQLPQPETIDLNVLLAPQSGWALTNAAAINKQGQIAGTGRIGNDVRAYRLSPPQFESPLVRLFTLAETMLVIGGVAVGGGGFGITPDGRIIPIPPPTPERIAPEKAVQLLRETIQQLTRTAHGEEARNLARLLLKAGMEEARRMLTTL